MNRAGMSLLRMGSPEDARILDDVDLTLTLHSLTIVNKVMEGYRKQTSTVSSSQAVSKTATRRVSGGSVQGKRPRISQLNNLPLGTAHVVLSKEQVRRQSSVTKEELTS